MVVVVVVVVAAAAAAVVVVVVMVVVEKRIAVDHPNNHVTDRSINQSDNTTIYTVCEANNKLPGIFKKKR